MGHLHRVLGTQVQDGKRLILPHLYFTYIFMSLMSSFVYHLLGRDVLISLFGWYYFNSVDQVLLGAAVLEMLIRVPLINKKSRV